MRSILTFLLAAIVLLVNGTSAMQKVIWRSVGAQFLYPKALSVFVIDYIGEKYVTLSGLRGEQPVISVVDVQQEEFNMNLQLMRQGWFGR